MITILSDIPQNVVAFKATGTITKEDFQKIVTPTVEALIKKTGQINFLLYLDTDIDNFTIGAWFEDAMLGLKNLLKWKRAAIVTDSKNIIAFTKIFSLLLPSEFKGFSKESYDEALLWVASE